jgi:hypothetical protein
MSNTPRTKRKKNSPQSQTPSPVLNDPKKVKSSSAAKVLNFSLQEDCAEMTDQTELKAFMQQLVTNSETKILKILEPIKLAVERLDSLHQQVSQLTAQVKNRNRNQRKNNIIIYGIAEKKGEKWNDREFILQELAKKLGLADLDFDYCQRIGKYFENSNNPRPLLVKLLRFRDKQKIFANKSKIREDRIFINDDLDPDFRHKGRRYFQQSRLCK